MVASTILKPVKITASGYEPNSTNTPDKAFDGLTSTRWSVKGDGQWIQADLGSNFKVTSVKIAWYNGTNQRKTTFDIASSLDGITYTTLVSKKQSSGTTLALEEYTFPEQLARYVRIVCHGNNINLWNSITEVNIMGYVPDTTPPTVTINPSGGTYNSSQNITISASETSSIFFTLNGGTATAYTSPISASNTTTISAWAIDTSGNKSTPITSTFTINIPAPQPPTIPFMHGVNKSPRSLSTVTTQAKIEKFIADNGFGLLRVRAYYADYFADPAGYIAKIKETADAADAAGLKVIYCLGMQVNLSPYFAKFGRAATFIGFPSEMVEAVIGPYTSWPTEKDAMVAFMRKYWDNKDTTLWNGKKLWDAHAEFALAIINGAGLANRASTLGYEIFNEPPLNLDVDFANLAGLQSYIGNKIIAVDADAWIIANHPFLGLWTDSISKPTFWNVANIAESLPKVSNGKVVYAPHTYTKSWISGTGQNDWNYMKNEIAQVQANTGVKVIIGEWAVEVEPAEPAAIATIIADAKAKGWPLCWWSFDTSDLHHALYTGNYDENAPKFWSAVLQGMGKTSTVGSPK